MIGMVFVIQSVIVWGHPNDVAHQVQKINGKTVNIVIVNANSKDLRFGVVKGNDNRKGWEPFANIINRQKPIAAINGNYFNAYSKTEEEMVPWGYIIQEGEMINSGAGESKGAFAVMKDGRLLINNSGEIDLDKVQTMVEAGPLLLLDGKVVYQTENNGFSEDKINKNPAQRSAIGIKPDGRVLMVTCSNIKMMDMANVMLSLGCSSATNLDGGASSALYAKGKYLTKPGRNLNTVLCVYDRN